ncbi:MAG: response regulator transcription factor [bacterium]|nr:response regulator transcription factor [bacterium]
MKIFFVEDDKDIRDSVKSVLEHEGFVVDALEDGDIALKRILTHPTTYSVIILDMGLPKMNGKDICRHVRKENIGIPVIMLTGTKDVKEKVEALNAGADDYLTKPFFSEELVARIHALMRRPKQTLQDECLTVSSLKLYPLTKKFFKGKKEIKLTAKEFQILELLMSRPDQVITRTQLLEHAWDFNYSSFTNVVDVHVNSIRHKLGMNKDSVLETVHGIGYKLKS